MTNKILCIYHGNCADGFGAAWAVRAALGDDVEFFAGVHGNEPPDVAGRRVLIVDFSYKRPVLEEMAKKVTSLKVLDHHKSAQEDLAGFAEEMSMNACDVDVVFDMDRSGAGITWDYFFPDKKRPRLIDHIEDRDLWKFGLPMTREIQAAIFSYPYDFKVWDKLADSFDEFGNTALVGEGLAIERKHHKDIAELVGVCKRTMEIGGHLVPVASLPYTLTSDAGHLMCKPADNGIDGVEAPAFAACYWDTPEGRVFSLRSDDEWGGEDVSKIAVEYGGGGHRNASGFRVPFEKLAELGLQ